VVPQVEEYACIICGEIKKKSKFNREHIIPQNIGGTLYVDNVVCKSCNSSFGSEVDNEILFFPETLSAFKELDLAHNEDKIISASSNLIGQCGDLTLKHGRPKQGKIYFPSQKVSDGSMLIPTNEFNEYIEKLLNREKRNLFSDLQETEIIKKLNQIQSLHSGSDVDSELKIPELGLTIKKRSAVLVPQIIPKKKLDPKRLLHKIAYEFLFFLAGREIFCEENGELISPILSFIQDPTTQGLDYFRVNPYFSEFRPNHYISLKFIDSVTIFRFSFFSKLDFTLIGKPLGKEFARMMNFNLKTDNVNGIVYQQELKVPHKTFWAYKSDGTSFFIGTK
jgi:hypothetical protein